MSAKESFSSDDNQNAKYVELPPMVAISRQSSEVSSESAIRIGRHEIYQQTTSGIIKKTKICPKIKTKEEAEQVAKVLCVKLYEFKIQLSLKDSEITRLRAENTKLKGYYLKLLQEKEEVEQHVALLQAQLDDLKRKYVDLKDSFDSANEKNEDIIKHLNEELKETKSDFSSILDSLVKTNEELSETKKIVEQLQRPYVLAGICSWVKHARSQILQQVQKDDVMFHDVQRRWLNLCEKIKCQPEVKREVDRTVKQLFDLEPHEWKIISVEFYKDAKGITSYGHPTVSETLKLIEHLPPPYNSNKLIFRTLIQKSAALNTVEDGDDYLY